MDRYSEADHKADITANRTPAAKPPSKAAKPVARTTKSQGGRPTSYRPEYAEQAKKLARLGAIDKEIAEFFEVAESTVNLWKIKHPEFSESLKAGKTLADGEVAEKLYQRATGYEHKAVKIVADAKTGAEHQVEYTERYPPDTTAIIFWLKNRRPDLWRDRIDNTHSGPDGGAMRIESTVQFVEPAQHSEDGDE